MKKTHFFMGILPVLFLMISCDGLVQYDYRIENKTSEPIEVRYPTYHAEGSDTSITLLPLEIIQVYSNTTVAAVEVDIYKDDDNVLNFLFIDSLAKDSFDLCKRKLWNLEWEHPSHAIYTLTIED